MSKHSENNTAIQATQTWLEKVVIGLNLCPFASKPFKENQVHFALCEAEDEIGVVGCLETELERLIAHSDKQQGGYIETTLVILDKALADFESYNQFLNLADDILHHHDLVGQFQIASFHPHYQFGGTHPNDRENLTNRSPYPILHLIREESLEAVLKNYPNPEAIPEHNIQTLEKLNETEIKQRFPYL